MCYNVKYLERRAQKYADRYHHVLPPHLNIPDDNLFPEFHFVSGFTFPCLPIITNHGIKFCQWGLIPHWCKNENQALDIRSKTLNAVSETIFEKPSYRQIIFSHRGILGINGFYDWRTFGKEKFPYYIQVPEQSIFSIGVIYDEWLNQETGEVLPTFSMITTPANPLMAQVHNEKKRMPFIIPPNLEAHWLNPSLTKEEIVASMQPFDEKQMTAHTIHKMAGNPKYNRNIPEISEPFNYEQLPPITL